MCYGDGALINQYLFNFIIFILVSLFFGEQNVKQVFAHSFTISFCLNSNKINCSAHFNFIYRFFTNFQARKSQNRSAWVNCNVGTKMCSKPKFLLETHVKYMTNLRETLMPWVLTTLLYVWCVDVCELMNLYDMQILVFWCIHVYSFVLCENLSFNLSLILMSKALPWYLTLSNNDEPDEAQNQVFFN